MSTPPSSSVLAPPRTVRAARYVTPLREGGSLPAVIETDDGDLVVAKFRGAGQGAAALVAEVIAGRLARALDLDAPEVVILELDDELARTERDEEIGDLLRASRGTNVALAYLGGAIGFDRAGVSTLDPELAARIVIFDAFVTNVDRTARNPNLLWWKDGLWLIDHGAALYWHHGWDGRSLEQPARAFPLVKDHVLLPFAGDLARAGAELVEALHDAVLASAVEAVPDALLPAPAADRRAAYVAFLKARRDGSAAFIEEAVRARRGV